ncbi:hypothetical protein GCM10010187_06700 [Actinomadura coerulea]|nr:hypothetical protein GCM10010187_06700 [Actinomadura coerulea]
MPATLGVRARSNASTASPLLIDGLPADAFTAPGQPAEPYVVPGLPIKSCGRKTRIMLSELKTAESRRDARAHNAGHERAPHSACRPGKGAARAR